MDDSLTEAEALGLYGTVEPPAAGRSFRRGAASFTLEAGALRHIRLDGTELLRAISFPVRDRDWGTLAPEMSDLTITETPEALCLGFTATFRAGAAELPVAFAITLSDRALEVTARGRSRGAFTTNRAGFTVLHPILGLAGAPVRVEHGDGRVEAAALPLLIAPWQPFQDIRALTHRVATSAGALEVECRLEGDSFEMEDQRQWGDASYKTYNRPLALPWPYCIADGEEIGQAVRLSWTPVSVPAAAPALPAAPAGARFPETALVLTAAEARRAVTRPADLAAIGPQRILCHLDTAAGQGLAELEAFAALQKLHPAAYDLELIARCPPGGDLDQEFAGYAEWVAQAGLRPASVMVCPSVDRQSTPPGSDWPACPPLEQVHRAARRAFGAGMTMGGGMASFFPELNRKRPPVALLDFATHGLSPIVHAADDVSVVEGLEAVPFILASARAILGDLPYRFGPSTIAMRQNPYGSRTIPNPDRIRICMSDDDPRQDGAFAAAWTLGLAACLGAGGVEVWTPAALYGPRGLYRDDGTARPLAAVVARLAGLAGGAVGRAGVEDGLAVLEVGETRLVANLGPVPRRAFGGDLPAWGWHAGPRA